MSARRPMPMISIGRLGGWGRAGAAGHPPELRALGIVVAVAVVFGSAADASAAGKDLGMGRHIGKPFSDVRGKLVADGWEPQETNLTTAKGVPERSRGEAGKLLEAGYPEVERCTGGSRNYCFFNYKRRGQCLRVRTLGVLNPPEVEPKVHGAGDACPSKQSKR